VTIPKKFLDWIPTEKLIWQNVCRWIDSSILQKIKNPEKLDRKMLSENKNAIEFLEENKYLIYWDALSINPHTARCIATNAIDLIKKYTCNMTKNIHICSEKIECSTSCICIARLCQNENAIELIKTYIQQSKRNNKHLLWDCLSENPNAIELLIINFHQIDWESASLNEHIVPLFECLSEENVKLIFSHWLCWDNLSKNKHAIPFLEKHLDTPGLNARKHISIRELCSNENGMNLLKTLTHGFTTNMKYIEWYEFSKNQNAFPVIEHITDNFTKNIDKIKPYSFCQNKNPKLIDILKNNPSLIDWQQLSGNTNAIEMLKHNQDKICWYFLSYNKGIIEDDVVRYKRLLSIVTKYVYNF
jgi:hypothetical protein